VHKPMFTDDWSFENLDEKIAAVRRLYQRTLKS